MSSSFAFRLLSFQVIIFCLVSGFSAFAQRIKVNGTVIDEITQAPIREVNIKINGTNQGVFSDKEGRFSLILEKIPASLTLSCIGYETVFYDIAKISQKPLEMIMRPRVYGLKEVEIPASKYRFVFRDMDYSVLDYEIMDDNILLLIFRYQLRRSEIVLLSLSGDTVLIAPVPEQKPRRLFKDFLGHVHYVSSEGNAFQCFYNDSLNQIRFIYQTTFDSLRTMARPFLFAADDRVYFQEFTPDGFGTNIGFFDKEHHKEYIRFFSGETTRKKYYGDLMFDSRWNDHILGTTSQLGLNANEPHLNSQSKMGGASTRSPALASDDDLRANKLFNYQKINAPLIKLGENSMAVFHFSDDMIELMDLKGKVYRTVPISFHKENEDNLLASMISAFVPVADWKWRGKILVDDYYRTVYTTFQKNGMTQIRKIDLETGNLTKSYNLPLSLPEKIQIYKGDAYFLIRGTGESEKWKLARVKL